MICLVVVHSCILQNGLWCSFWAPTSFRRHIWAFAVTFRSSCSFVTINSTALLFYQVHSAVYFSACFSSFMKMKKSRPTLLSFPVISVEEVLLNPTCVSWGICAMFEPPERAIKTVCFCGCVSVWVIEGIRKSMHGPFYRVSVSMFAI